MRRALIFWAVGVNEDSFPRWTYLYFYNINNKDHTFSLAANKLFQKKKRGEMIERVVLGGEGEKEIESWSQCVFPSSPSNCTEMCRDLEGYMWTQGLLGISYQLVKVKWRCCGSHTSKKNNFFVPFCLCFSSSQQCLMHVIDSLWFFWGRVSWIASCSCSRDHLELTACPPDSYLPLSNQPVNHQAFVHTLCAHQASFAVG